MPVVCELNRGAYQGRTALYWLYDAQNVLLYIGITWQILPDRMKGHAGEQYWWQEVNHATAIWYETRDEAERAETRAIKAERPKYNKSKTQSSRIGSQRRRHIAPQTRGVAIRDLADGRWIRVPPGVGVQFVYPCAPGTAGYEAGFMTSTSVTVLPCTPVPDPL